MFALLSLDDEPTMNLKCDPDEAIDLRERYSYVLPGYHMNKALWNTVMIDEMTLEQLLLKWINDSYALVIEKLPKKDREALARLSEN